MKYADIPKFPRAHYSVNVPIEYIERTIARWQEHQPPMAVLDICPDFQRGHVWSGDQQIAWMEYFMRGGESGLDIYFNHPNWMGSFEGDFVLVDGLQRLTAVRQFMSDDLRVFGALASEYDILPISCSLRFNVAILKTRADVLQWYLDFNSGGTPHSGAELDRVQGLLNQERYGVGGRKTS